jgi:hypothetical protein
VRASFAASSLALLVASGCATLDRSECLNADWYAIGLEDGARGRAIERLGNHRRACARHNIAPDSTRYLAGRNDGLKSFCTQERGYAEGRAGHAHLAGCPEKSGFIAAYQRGRELHELERRLTEVEKELSRTRNALKEGIANPRARAVELERLEALTREAAELESRIRQFE